MIERGDRIGWDRVRSAGEPTARWSVAPSQKVPYKARRRLQHTRSLSATLTLSFSHYISAISAISAIAVRFGLDFWVVSLGSLGWGGDIRFVVGFYFLVFLVVFITFVFFSCRNKFIFYFRYVHTYRPVFKSHLYNFPAFAPSCLSFLFLVIFLIALSRKICPRPL